MKDPPRESRQFSLNAPLNLLVTLPGKFFAVLKLDGDFGKVGPFARSNRNFKGTWRFVSCRCRHLNGFGHTSLYYLLNLSGNGVRNFRIRSRRGLYGDIGIVEIDIRKHLHFDHLESKEAERP